MRCLRAGHFNFAHSAFVEVLTGEGADVVLFGRDSKVNRTTTRRDAVKSAHWPKMPPPSQRQISPWWAIIAGFAVVPLASGFNVALVHLFFAPVFRFDGLLLASFGEGIGIAFVDCLPLSVITFGVIESWNGGHYRETRLWCLFLLFPSFLAWDYLCATGRPGNSVEMNYAATILPFVWTLLFPLFALCARAPKNR